MNISEIAEWKLAGINNVVFVPRIGDPGYILKNGHFIKRFSARRYHGFVLKLEGNCNYIIDDRYSVSSVACTLTYLPMGKPYVAESYLPGECFCVNFLLDCETNLQSFSYQVRNFQKWHSMFTALLHSWNYRQPGYQAKTASILYDMFASVVEECSARYLPMQQRSAIQELMQSVSTKFADVSIVELAKQCNMSETYFRRIFKSLYGTSPKQYIQDARFRQAKELLSATGISVAQIAEMCGYENTYIFSRAFHIHEGVSPSEFRKLNCGEKCDTDTETENSV